MTHATIVDARPDRGPAVARAVKVLARGGLVVFPTETVYGVGAAVDQPEALARLAELKQRPIDKPFSVHLGDPAEAERLIDFDVQPLAARLIRKTMPGPITIVVEVDDATIERKLAALGLSLDDRNRLYHNNTIGLRCPDNPVGAQLLRQVDAPVVASSANNAGDPPPHTAEAAARAIGDRVDLVLDGGPARYAEASTVVRVSGDRLEVLREGVLDERYLQKLLGRSILFVCSGNTCRSPMAEAIARAALAERLGVDADELDQVRWQVRSAGAFAAEGMPATPEAVAALHELGIEPHAHRSRPLTAAMIRQADAIFTMTESHRQAVLAIAPDAADKVHRLDAAGDIEDPIGGHKQTYVDIARRMQQLVQRQLDALKA